MTAPADIFELCHLAAIAGEYEQYLLSKRVSAIVSGFVVDESEIDERAFAWQRRIVRWAVRRGKAALFCDTGLGKTLMQLKWARLVHEYTGGDVLILAPLAVAEQTAEIEGPKWGVEVNLCRTQADVLPGINITNYDMLEHFDARRFVGVVLDESSILKSYSGTTKKALIDAFANTRYKLCCTATPSPNDHMEIGNHAQFLDVMSSSEMLSRWFLNDTMKAGGYRLKSHASKDFWRWVATWAVSLSRPSDIGFSDEGFWLPPLETIQHVVKVDTSIASEGMLFRSPDMSATGLHKEMRLTAPARAAKVAEIVNLRPNEPWLVWCNTDYEADELRSAMPGLVEVKGSDSREWKVTAIQWFRDRKCICEERGFRAKLATWQSTQRDTGKSTTLSTESSESQNQTLIKKSTDPKERNISRGGSPQISRISKNTETSPLKNATQQEGMLTPQILPCETGFELHLGTGRNKIQRSDSAKDSSDSASPSPHIGHYSKAKATDAQSVTEQSPMPTEQMEAKDSTLTIATEQEQCEDFYVRHATSESGSSAMTQTDSNEQRCICGSATGRQWFSSKPSMFGMGLNLQNCRNVIFVGLSYSYEQYYQAIRRCWRFGQTQTVTAHIVCAETEGPVLATLHRKEKDHVTMKVEMIEAMKEQTMEELGTGPILRTDFTRETRAGNGWEMQCGDSVELIREVPDNHIRFSIFSPPFSNLYIYSDSVRDMGNTADDAEFFQAFGYLVKELYRATLPGRLCAVHCKDLPTYRGRDGASGLKDFPGDIIRLFESHGWDFHSRVTIWKCPVTERERTNNNGLLHKTVMRDSSQLRMGMADYMIVMRKTPQGDSNLSDVPIVRPDGFLEFVGESDPRKESFHPSPYARTEFDGKRDSIAIWRRYAEPVWWDINQTDVLNIKTSRTENEERHICPLQIGVIERAVEIWSLPGELVYSPFAGIGSEGVGSLKLDRTFLGMELKKTYFDIACRNLSEAEKQQGSLFDDVA